MSRSFFIALALAILVAMCGLLVLGTRFAVSEGQGSVEVMEPFWNVTRGGPRADEGWSVDIDADGNVYFTGFNRIASAYADVFLYKFAPDGSEVWNASWSGMYDDEAFIVTVADGYVYVGGRTFTNLSFDLRFGDMFVLKFHASNGSLVWDRTWDGGGNGYDEVDGLVVDGNSLYVAGWANGTSTWYDVQVLRFDVNGTAVWNSTWGTPNIDEANGQIGVDDNYVYVVGRCNALPPFGLGGDAVLVAFNKTDGRYAWNVTWGGAALDDAYGMTTDSGHIYSVGITNSFGGNRIFLLKYDKTGSLVWNATWGGNGAELARAVDINANSTCIYVAVNTKAYGNGDYDVALLRYDQNGNLTLSKTWGGPMLEQAHGMVVSDPFIYIAGETRSWGVGYEDGFLLKVDVEGGNTIPEYGWTALPILLILTLAACTVYLALRKYPLT